MRFVNQTISHCLSASQTTRRSRWGQGLRTPAGSIATMEPGLSANELTLFHVARTGVGQQDTGWHVVVVVQQYMRLYPAPGASEPCLREHLQAQRNGGRVQRKLCLRPPRTCRSR